jgi:hypothetical protein
MYSRAEQFRRRGIGAQQLAAQAKDEATKEAFELMAREWFALAEQVEWLDRQHRDSRPFNPDEISE